MGFISRLLRNLSPSRRAQKHLRRHADDAKTAFTARYEYEKGRPEGRQETVCGAGSTMAHTRVARETVARVVREYGVTSMLDAPCGDLNWMRHVPLDGVRYIGGDVVQPLIEENRRLHGGPAREFVVLDVITDPLPTPGGSGSPVDLILCRDCLVHLRSADVQRALVNFSSSGARYLLTTTFPAVTENPDLRHPGEWRAINLRIAPFLLPPPLLLIDEECPDANGRSKSLGLWKLPF